jgi:hypothetical protein
MLKVVDADMIIVEKHIEIDIQDFTKYGKL